jgi:hypothetical protein
MLQLSASAQGAPHHCWQPFPADTSAANPVEVTFPCMQSSTASLAGTSVVSLAPGWRGSAPDAQCCLELAPGFQLPACCCLAMCLYMLHWHVCMALGDDCLGNCIYYSQQHRSVCHALKLSTWLPLCGDALLQVAPWAL